LYAWRSTRFLGISAYAKPKRKSRTALVCSPLEAPVSGLAPTPVCERVTGTIASSSRRSDTPYAKRKLVLIWLSTA
jgi:hypothetical protein